MGKLQPGAESAWKLLFFTLCTSGNGWIIPLGCIPEFDGSCLCRVTNIDRLMGDAKPNRLSCLADLVDD
jgi:hypothetical protein